MVYGKSLFLFKWVLSQSNEEWGKYAVGLYYSNFGKYIDGKYVAGKEVITLVESGKYVIC